MPSWVRTDSGWNWTEAKCGPRREWTSPLAGSRLTSTVPTSGQSFFPSVLRAAKVL